MMPWYRIVNCLENWIETSQHLSTSTSPDPAGVYRNVDLFSLRRITQMESIGWHRSDSNVDTRLHFRTENTDWSLGNHGYCF